MVTLAVFILCRGIIIFCLEFQILGHSHVGLLLTTGGGGGGGGGGGDLSCENDLAFLIFHLLVFEKCMCKSREKEEANVN